MIGDYKRFNMKLPPLRQSLFIRILTWLLSFPAVYKHKAKINRINMNGLKPPYLLLCNHNSFLDFKVMTAAIFPHRANYVVAIDGYIRRKWLMRLVGCICTRKFTNDLMLVKNMFQTIKQGDIVVLYPEARYSLCGTGAVLPDSLGKLIKKVNVPVVTLIMHGHHVNSPFWNTKNRSVKAVEADFKLLYTPEQLQSFTAHEINAALKKHLNTMILSGRRIRELKFTILRERKAYIKYCINVLIVIRNMIWIQRTMGFGVITVVRDGL